MLRPLGRDPVAAYRAAAKCVLDAFAADGALDRDFPLPEIASDQMFPARQAISFHLVDYVVHSWDVARTLGLPVDLDPALVDTALRVSQAVPGGAARLEPGAAFGPMVDWPGGSGLDRIVALLGRSPGWIPGRQSAE
jgi:uncharacterized protein (TIGR03086 family)